VTGVADTLNLPNMPSSSLPSVATVMMRDRQENDRVARFARLDCLGVETVRDPAADFRNWTRFAPPREGTKL
jgi:hypothetical protein